jgi:hypothetical protein
VPAASAAKRRSERPPGWKPKKLNKRRARVAIDKRFVLGRRVKELVATFRARLGPIADDPVLAANVKKAAELQALAEESRARALRANATATLNDVVRLSRLADYAVRKLQLDRHVKPSVPSLLNYLAARREGQP